MTPLQLHARLPAVVWIFVVWVWLLAGALNAEAEGGPVLSGEIQEATQLSGKDAVELAAPQLSDEQIIKNAQDIAYELYHAEDYKAAAQTCAQILERYPKRKLYWVHYLLALSYEHQQLYEKAIENYEKVRKFAPRSTYYNAATFRLGISQMKLGHQQDAILTFHDVIETHPRSEYRLQGYVHLGNLYRRRREWKSAERIYKDLIRLYPETAWAHTGMMYLAESYAHQQEERRAIKIYESMQRTDSVPLIFQAQAQLRVGELHLAAKRWLEALQSFRIALRDYAHVPGVAVIAEEKIALAREGQRSGEFPLKKTSQIVISAPPEDAGYRLKQQKEAVPY